MTDKPADQPSPAEKAATRRRWITIGEVVAVSGLVISGLTFWDAHRSREEERADARAAAARDHASTVNARLVLRATPSKDADRLTLMPGRSDQTIQTQSISFPAGLGLSAIDTTGDARIEASWFARALKKAREAAGRDGATKGDERLPILVTTTFLAGDVERSDRAIYEVGYAVTDGGLFSGGDVLLRGLSLNGKAGTDGQQRIDAIWASRMPAKK